MNYLNGVPWSQFMATKNCIYTHASYLGAKECEKLDAMAKRAKRVDDIRIYQHYCSPYEGKPGQQLSVWDRYLM